MKVNLEELNQLVEKKLVSVQKHPKLELFIYNYTQKCQFDHLWTPLTKMCRGLILDGDGTVIARPYDKFFNMEEHDKEEIPKEKFMAFDKADGSLGIMYMNENGDLALATRGSFVSEQAYQGTKMLHEVMLAGSMFHIDEMTYLFEIIYPENRIVIDYKGQRKLIFLGAREIGTGKIFTPDYFPNIQKYFEAVSPIEDYNKPRDNAEGVVLYYANGFMCKVKYEEYVRLHRLVTGVNARRIWDIMRNKGSLKELLERVPEEFSEWVHKTHDEIHKAWAAEMIYAEEAVAKARKMETRKEQAVFLTKNQMEANSKICFCLLDGKQEQAEQVAWMMVKPEAERPFREDL